MNGDVDYIEDATEMLLEALDDEDVEVDDDSAEELARQLWSECLAASEQWVDDVTDVDRVVEAFEELEERGIAYGIFMDWSDIQPVEPDRGRVLIWVNEWENLSHEEVRDLRIGYTGTGAPDDEVAAELVAPCATPACRRGVPRTTTSRSRCSGRCISRAATTSDPARPGAPVDSGAPDGHTGAHGPAQPGPRRPPAPGRAPHRRAQRRPPRPRRGRPRRR
ncbi:DUF6891 domain-containing protein [Tessaracoccus lubricantis]